MIEIDTLPKIDTNAGKPRGITRRQSAEIAVSLVVIAVLGAFVANLITWQFHGAPNSYLRSEGAKLVTEACERFSGSPRNLEWVTRPFCAAHNGQKMVFRVEFDAKLPGGVFRRRKFAALVEWDDKKGTNMRVEQFEAD